jgi:hypothetical protein
MAMAVMGKILKTKNDLNGKMVYCPELQGMDLGLFVPDCTYGYSISLSVRSASSFMRAEIRFEEV